MNNNNNSFDDANGYFDITDVMPHDTANPFLRTGIFTYGNNIYILDTLSNKTHGQINTFCSMMRQCIKSAKQTQQTLYIYTNCPDDSIISPATKIIETIRNAHADGIKIVCKSRDRTTVINRQIGRIITPTQQSLYSAFLEYPINLIPITPGASIKPEKDPLTRTDLFVKEPYDIYILDTFNRKSGGKIAGFRRRVRDIVNNATRAIPQTITIHINCADTQIDERAKPILDMLAAAHAAGVKLALHNIGTTRGAWHAAIAEIESRTVQGTLFPDIQHKR